MSQSYNLKSALLTYLSIPHTVKETAAEFNTSASYAFTSIQKLYANGEVTLSHKIGNSKFYRALEKEPKKETPIIYDNKPRLISFANQTRPLSSDCIGSSKKLKGWEGYSSPINKA